MLTLSKDTQSSAQPTIVEKNSHFYLSPVADRFHFYSPWQRLDFDQDDAYLVIQAMRAVVLMIQNYGLQRIVIRNGDLLSSYVSHLYGGKIFGGITGVKEVRYFLPRWSQGV